jgi:capsular exopolysaccharide synthesis family protein
MGLEGLKNKVKVLSFQESELKKQVKELEVEARQIGRSSIDVEMLKFEVTALQDVLSRLAGELQRTQIEMQPEKTGDSKTGFARVMLMSEAMPARAIENKTKAVKTAGAGVAGFLLPILFVVWLDARKKRINSGTEVVQGLGLSVIGSVPLIPQRVMRRLDGTSAREQYWRTLLSESVDSIAAVLLHGAESGTCRTVMVSSANAGEGKTTLAAHLATSLAGAGCRTALIDFDLRRPALHRVLGQSLQPGVVDLLQEPDKFESAVQATQIPNLMFVAAGRWNSSGLSRLASSDLKCLFERLRSEFDFVVVDGSPILPVVDTRLIAQHVDAVVLSVLRDVSCTPQLRAACQLLELFSVPILGVVVTGSRGDVYHTRYDAYTNVKAM